MKLIVGLGNPGREYERTRHNVGFAVVERLAERVGAAFRRNLRVAARSCRVAPEGGGEWLLVEPLTYMNCSGDAVAPLMRRHGLGPADLLAVVDDAALPAGRLRVRSGGSAGGHNGLKSLIERIGTDEFARVRIGVGRDPAGRDLKDHVLSRFAPDERELIAEAVEKAADAVGVWACEGVDRAMNQFNG